MKTNKLVLLAAAAAVLAAFAGTGRAEERGRGSGRGGERMEGRRESGGGGRMENGGEFRLESRGPGPGVNRAAESDGGRTVTRMRSVTMSRPERLEQDRVINDNRRIAAPRQYEDGRQVREREAVAPPRQHSEIAGDRDAMRGIGQQRGVELQRNRYYWHDYGHRRYAHFRDDDDIDWYGFYFGPSFYWTRYYGDRWWWYDEGYARWVFWWNGYWWWQGPGGMAYVYMDDNYYPYQEGGVTVRKSTTVPSQVTPPAGEGKEWNSPDLRRLVKILGPEDEAFLYDRTGGKQVYLAFLGKGVEKVRFSGGVTDQPLKILLDFKDGTFALFDADGKSEQPQAPESVPPLPALPPPSAPGDPGVPKGN